jgi:hypothetical protein
LVDPNDPSIGDSPIKIGQSASESTFEQTLSLAYAGASMSTQTIPGMPTLKPPRKFSKGGGSYFV